MRARNKMYNWFEKFFVVVVVLFAEHYNCRPAQMFSLRYLIYKYFFEDADVKVECEWCDGEGTTILFECHM